MTEQIYTTRKLKRGFFGFKVERPQAAPGKVLVLTGGGAPIVLWPGQKPTAGEAAWNRYDTVTEIDTVNREFNFTAPVAAKGGDVAFQMTFSAGYKVNDPVKVLNEGLLNPEPALRRVITERVSRITEQFDIEDAQGAVAAVRDLVDKGKYTEKLPFELSTVNVKLELDSQARDFLAKRRQQRRDAELAAGSKQLTEEQAKATKLSKQFDHDIQQIENHHDLDLERLRAEAALLLDNQRAQNQLQLEKQKAENALAIQQMRMEVYKPMIQGGMWDMLTLRLADNPSDVGKVSELIVQMHAQQLAADVSVLEAMIRGDVIKDHQLKDVTGDLVRRLRSSASGGGPTLGPAPERKQLAAETEESSAAAGGQENTVEAA